jgi:hypothetical protein
MIIEKRFTDGRGRDRVMGWYNTETRVFNAKKLTAHVTLKYDSLGTQSETMSELKSEGCKYICYEYTNEDGIITYYHTGFDDMWDYKLWIRLNEKDGLQCHMRRKDMRVSSTYPTFDYPSKTPKVLRDKHQTILDALRP